MNRDPLATALSAARVFPLPGMVLMPGASLPLHVFEPRYRALVADALEGDGRVIVAQIVEGQEPEAAGSPPVYPYAAIGRIHAHERLPDGRSNLVLEPEARVRLVRERGSTAPWRTFEAEVLPEVGADDPKLGAVGSRMLGMLGPVFSRFGSRGAAMERSLAALPPKAVPASLAPLLLRDGASRQAYLAEDDAVRRALRVEEALFTAFAESRAASAAEA